jgi:hypothetical protein
MQMRLFLAVLTALILSGTGCAFQADITIPKYAVQNQVDMKFPVEKDVVIAKAELKYPDVYFKGDHIGMRLQYVGRFLKKPAEGLIDFHGPLVYKPEKGAFYLAKIEIVNFTVNKESLSNRDKLQGTLESIINTFIMDVPVHRLKQRDFKEKLARLLLKKVRVKDETLILTVGV